jgi:DNA (cytosine-5)-methyltransferase 1
MKVLNLYCGIGGNRKLWQDVEVTAIELNPDIAKIYQDFFPDDKVIVTDAHQYLLDHFKEFNFIWGSPPCPTHSKARKQLAMKSWGLQNKPIYPDMKLYQEILLLQGYFDGKWVVENVIAWYEPLIIPFKFGGHYFWSNFHLGSLKTKSRSHDSGITDLSERKGFDLSNYPGIDKKLALRNCVEPEIGEFILNMARGVIKSQDILQKTIFD